MPRTPDLAIFVPTIDKQTNFLVHARIGLYSKLPEHAIPYYYSLNTSCIIDVIDYVRDSWPFSRPAQSQKIAYQVSKLTNKTAHPKMVARAKPLHRYTEINSFQQFLISHFCFLDFVGL